MTPMIELPQRLLDDMVAHAREREPEEACGLLGAETGPDGRRLTYTYRARNVAEEPTVRFEVHPQDLLQVFEIEQKGWELGIYHSHPRSPAYPSATDVGHAQRWPGIYHLILSLRHPNAPEVNAYRIEDGEITPEALRIVDG